MRNPRLLPLVVAALVSVVSAAPAQQPSQQPSASPAPGGAPGTGAARPEHALLKMDEGTWDAQVEVFMGPNTQPMVSKGVEVNTLGCNGTCLITDFRADIVPGTPFHGHGTTVYDPARQKFVGAWADSMSAGLAIGESTYDPATKTSTGWMQGTDPAGNTIKTRTVGEYKDENTRVFTVYAPGPDGKEFPTMRATYSRRR